MLRSISTFFNLWGKLWDCFYSTEILHVLNLLICLEPEQFEAAAYHVNKDMKKRTF